MRVSLINVIVVGRIRCQVVLFSRLGQWVMLWLKCCVCGLVCRLCGLIRWGNQQVIVSQVNISFRVENMVICCRLGKGVRVMLRQLISVVSSISVSFGNRWCSRVVEFCVVGVVRCVQRKQILQFWVMLIRLVLNISVSRWIFLNSSMFIESVLRQLIVMDRVMQRIGLSEWKFSYISSRMFSSELVLMVVFLLLVWVLVVVVCRIMLLVMILLVWLWVVWCVCVSSGMICFCVCMENVGVFSFRSSRVQFMLLCLMKSWLLCGCIGVFLVCFCIQLLKSLKGLFC